MRFAVCASYSIVASALGTVGDKIPDEEFMQCTKNSRGDGTPVEGYKDLSVPSKENLSCYDDTVTPNERLSPESSPNEDSCSLYLAPSTIPNTGFGVFTTKAFKEGSIILSPDAPGVIVIDLESNQPDRNSPNWGHYNYWWGTDEEADYEAVECSSVIVTLGSLPNSHLYLRNIQVNDMKYDDTVADRLKDPEAGAFSYYETFSFGATRDIEAGEEVFANYGLSWFEGRGIDTLQEENVLKADMIRDLMKAHHLKNGGDRIADESQLKVINDIVAVFDEHAASLLPKTPAEFTEDIADDRTLGRKIDHMRSMDWIIENGHCLDNMVMKQSTIPRAGKGAFASRFLPKESMIVPTPLVLIHGRDSLSMRDPFQDVSAEGNDEKIVGTQIILNYCFGHNESSLLLCPATNALLVNHCSSRQFGEGECGADGPNAEYRWSSGWDPTAPEVLQMSLENLSEIIEGHLLR